MTKNNKALRAALVLCVLALFCAAFVGATFAKYVTNDNAADTARAAKWGVSVSIGGTLFGADYASVTAGATGDTIILADSENVKSSDAWDIVAPGTKSDKGIIITLDGKPEVAYDVDTEFANIEDLYLGKGNWGAMVKVYDVTEDNFDEGTYYTLDGDDFEVVEDLTAYQALPADTQLYELRDTVAVGDNGYYPIVWNLKAVVNGVENGTEGKGVNYTSLAALVEALDASVDALDGTANVQFKAKYTITWAWAYDVDVDDDTADKQDTVIGNLIENVLTADQNPEMVPVYSANGTAWAVASDDVAATAETIDDICNLDINFNYKVTITQVN